jgi:hypothetical protein
VSSATAGNGGAAGFAGSGGAAGNGSAAESGGNGGRTTGDGERLDHYWQAHMTMPFNICNRVPIVNVPSGMADCGIPTGVQVIAHPFDDTRAFDVAAAIEQLMPMDRTGADSSDRLIGWMSRLSPRWSGPERSSTPSQR